MSDLSRSVFIFFIPVFSCSVTPSIHPDPKEECKNTSTFCQLSRDTGSQEGLKSGREGEVSKVLRKSFCLYSSQNPRGGGLSCTLPLGSDGPEIEWIAYPMPEIQSVSQVAFVFPKLQQFLTKWFRNDYKNCGEIQMQLLKYFDPITGQDQSDREKTEPQDTTAVRCTYTRAIQLKFIYFEKATKFCEISTSPPIQCQSKVRWRFRKILWPFQKI